MPEHAPTSRPPAPTRTLVPHEHGAYGQLAFPLLTALAIGRPTAPALLLTYAIVVSFVAHESLLVVLGQRGKRASEGDGPRARRVLAILGVQAVAAGLAGLALAPPMARAALALPVALAAAVGWLVARREEKTLLGEILVAGALSSGGLAVALAAGAPPSWALGAWITWLLAFSAATLAVQAVLIRARSKGQRDPGLAHAAASLLLAAGAFAAVPLAGLPRAAPFALLPTAVLSVGVCVSRVSPKRLRELGWAMVASGVVTALVLVAGLRWAA
jgi:YwiC-like protein